MNVPGDLPERVSGVFQITKQEAVTGLVLDVKDRLGARVRLGIVVFLIVLPAALALFFIRTYAVNVVWWDEWAIVPLFDKLLAGHLPTIRDLLVAHNEHIILVPRLTILLLGLMTSWNTVAECYFSWFLLCLIGGVLFLTYRRMFGTRGIALAGFIPVSWLIFSLRQHENLLWGFQMAFFLAVFFFLLAIHLLRTSQRINWRFGLSMISGTLCTLSMGNGISIWPIGLILLVVWARQSQAKEASRRYLKMASIWCVVSILAFAAVSVVLNKSGVRSPISQHGLSWVTSHWQSSFAYALVAIGSPLSDNQWAAMGVGALLLLLYIYVGGTILLATRAQASAALPLSMILFALLSIALLTLGRSANYPVQQALQSRYTTFATLGVVGAYLAILSLEIKRPHVKPLLVGSLISLVVVGVAVSTCHGITEGRNRASAMRLDAYYLTTFEVQSDENLARVCLFPDLVRESAPVLVRLKLNVFSEPGPELQDLQQAEGPTLFSVETINGQYLSQQNSYVVVDTQLEKTLTISGWAIDEQARNKASAVFISIDGQRDVPALYGLDSSDVATRFGEDRYRSSGFLASFSTSLLEEGQHVLTLKIVAADKNGYYEPAQAILLKVE